MLRYWAKHNRRSRNENTLFPTPGNLSSNAGNKANTKITNSTRYTGKYHERSLEKDFSYLNVSMNDMGSL